MVSTFVNRETELKLLLNNWKSDSAELVVLFGRRRVGKTRLMQQFLKGKRGIFHTAREATKQAQINDLQRDVASYFNDSFLKDNIITTWESLFDYLLKLIPGEDRFYIFIDEFSYLIKSDAGIVGTLQKLWDREMSKTKIFLVLCGSILGMMQESVLSHASPLYGRRTRDILLEPLRLKSSLEFLGAYPFAERLNCYGILGGIPSYLLVAARYHGFNNLVENEFLNKQGFFYREPYYILSQEFRGLKTYFSILNAIALGKNSASEIANFSGIETRKIFPYLDNLLYLDFIKKEIPVTARTKFGKYYLKDNMLRFWFNFVDKNRTPIETEQYRFSGNAFNSYFGHVFEDIVRELIFRLPDFRFTEAGRWWHRDKEIDVVALDKNRILFVECKWQDKADVKRISDDLRQRASFVKQGSREAWYALFAKSFKRKAAEENLLLFDLKDIEQLIASRQPRPGSSSSSSSSQAKQSPRT